MSLTAGLFNSGLFKVGIFNGGLFKSSSTVSIVSLLFGASENGVLYDPSDFSTMFQDSAGTTPVTAVGQSVRKILDKSGNNNHAIQPTLTSAPILLQDGSGYYYLGFDGIDDFLYTSSINFSVTDKMSLFIGERKTADPQLAVLCEFTTSAANNGSFGIYAPRLHIDSEYGSISTGTLASDYYNSGINVGYKAPHTGVISALFDIANDVNNITVNVTTLNITIDQGTGNYSNDILYIGRRAGTSYPFSGYLYSMIIRGAISLSDEIIAAKAYVNSKTGAY